MSPNSKSSRFIKASNYKKSYHNFVIQNLEEKITEFLQSKLEEVHIDKNCNQFTSLISIQNPIWESIFRYIFFEEIIITNLDHNIKDVTRTREYVRTTKIFEKVTESYMLNRSGEKILYPNGNVSLENIDYCRGNN